jgi:hypothetical protein
MIQGRITPRNTPKSLIITGSTRVSVVYYMTVRIREAGRFSRAITIFVVGEVRMIRNKLSGWRVEYICYHRYNEDKSKNP